MFAAISASLLLFPYGCSHDKPATDPHAVAAVAAPAPAPDPELEIVTISSIGIDSRLATMCGIPTNKVFFKFDSAKLAPAAQSSLDDFANCATPAQRRASASRSSAGPIRRGPTRTTSSSA